VPDAAVLVALYSVAAYGRRLVAVAVLLVALGLLDLRTAAPFTFYGWNGGVVLFGLLLLASWFSGAYVGEMRARARTLERERDEQAEIAARAERERITRELHDVVAHGLSVMVVQAQGASAALRPRPEEAREALEAIVATGRQSLAEMRRLLGISRGEDQAGAPLAPQPGLAVLPELIEQVRAAGLPVELSVDGSARELPPGVDLSAYRVVQEGLTNTLKHAGRGAAASVRLRYLTETVEIEVENSGGSSSKTDGVRGRGLQGMGERAGLLGGTFEAGPKEEGRFLVKVQLPTQAPRE
jgi:signal transduction histidine kinase